MTTTPPRKKPAMHGPQIPNWMDPSAAMMGIAAPYLKASDPPALNKVHRAYDPELNDYRVLGQFNESTGKGWVYSTPKKVKKTRRSTRRRRQTRRRRSSRRQ